MDVNKNFNNGIISNEKYSSHFNLGAFNLGYQTTGLATYRHQVASSGDIENKKAFLSKDLKDSHFSLTDGVTKITNYTTQQQHSYANPITGNAAMLDPSHKKYLKSSHFNLG